MLLIPSSHIFFHPKEKMKKGHVSSPNILTWKKGLENEEACIMEIRADLNVAF